MESFRVAVSPPSLPGAGFVTWHSLCSAGRFQDFSGFLVGRAIFWLG